MLIKVEAYKLQKMGFGIPQFCADYPNRYSFWNLIETMEASEFTKKIGDGYGRAILITERVQFLILVYFLSHYPTDCSGTPQRLLLLQVRTLTHTHFHKMLHLAIATSFIEFFWSTNFLTLCLFFHVHRLESILYLIILGGSLMPWQQVAVPWAGQTINQQLWEVTKRSDKR